MENFNSPQMQQPTPPKSKKWIYIAVGAVVVVSLILIVAAIIGVAVYFLWAGKKEPYRPFEKPIYTNTNSNSNGNSGEFNRNTLSDTPSDSVSNQKLVKAIKSNPKIGRFTLQNVSPTTQNKIYRRSLGEVKAIYTSGNDSVTFILSEYKSQGTAVSDFGQMFDKAKREKARIIEPLRFGKGTVGVRFSIENVTMRAYCDWPANKEVLCNIISSANSDAVTEFNTALRK